MTISFKQKHLFNIPKQQNLSINQPQIKTLPLPKSLNLDQLQKEAMLNLRNSINRSSSKSTISLEIKFLKAIKREIYFKKGGPVIALIRDSLMS